MVVAKVIGIILIVGFCAFIGYEVYTIVRDLVRRHKKKKSVISTSVVDDKDKHGESE